MTKMGQKLSREEKIQKALLRQRSRRSKEYSKMLQKRQKLKRLAKRRVKLPSIKKLEEKLKKVMYPFIKQRDGNWCRSCTKKGLVGGLHGNWNAGHFLKAELCNLLYRYDPRNIHSQCVYCNKWLAGNTIEYRKWMVKEYGLATVQQMEEEYMLPLPLNFNPREYITSLINKYG